MGMSVDAIVRILLFLAVLGVVSMGFALDPKDPAGSAFLLGAGEIGHKLFGNCILLRRVDISCRRCLHIGILPKNLVQGGRMV